MPPVSLASSPACESKSAFGFPMDLAMPFLSSFSLFLLAALIAVLSACDLVFLPLAIPFRGLNFKLGAFGDLEAPGELLAFVVAVSLKAFVF